MFISRMSLGRKLGTKKRKGCGFEVGKVNCLTSNHKKILWLTALEMHSTK